MSYGTATPSDLSRLLNAANELVPVDAVVAVAGLAVAALPPSSRPFVPLGDGESPRDSAGAIVALERSRASGAAFLALPVPTDQWLDQLLLFGDHCRRRYPVVLESEHGTVLDLRAAADADEAHGDVELGGGPAGAEPLDAVGALASALSHLVHSGRYSADDFRRFEQCGVHVTPVHFYSPIPEISQLTDEVWQRESELVGIDMNDAAQIHLVTDLFPEFRDEYEALLTAPSEDEPWRFYFGNGLFDGTDALVLYCMLRHLRPGRVIEVGSGFSTRLAAEAALRNATTEIVCVEPYPDAVLQKGFPGLKALIPSRVEELPFDFFAELQENDVLFIDSSHVVRTGGDVNFLYLEVMPRLRPGVVVQIHDVFLPGEYARDWLVDSLRFWNEQYLLQAFLAFNADFEVLVANSYLHARHPEVLKNVFPTSPWWGGGSVWIRRSR